MAQVRYTFSEQEGASVLRLSGELTVDQVGTLYGEIRESVRPGSHLVVDLSQLSYIDSSGIAALVGLYKRASAEGGSLVVAGAKDEVMGVFRAMRLEKIFPFYDSVAQAVVHLSLTGRT